MYKSFSFTHLFLIMILGTLLAACGRLSPVTTPSPTPIPSTPTPQATSTPTPVPGKVILLAPPDLPANEAELAQALVTKLAGSTGLLVTTSQSLQPADITPETRLVVMLSRSENLPDLLAAAPKTQFLVVSSYELGAAPNLNVIRIINEKRAFLAGYITTLIAPDWRSAAFLPGDEAGGAALEDAFRNGAHYFCGRCNSVMGPVISFPTIGRYTAAGGDPGAWQSLLASLNEQIIYTVYIDPLSSTPDLLNTLASQGLVLTGSQSPPEEIKPHWAATIGFDTLKAVETLWTKLINGEGGQVVNAELIVSDIRPEFLSPGRQRLAENVRQGLNNDTLYPFTIQP